MNEERLLKQAILDDNMLNTTAPNFNTTDGNGLYQTNDNDGITYYFRGNIDNNYVSFANSLWRIIRINGNNSIRLIKSEAIGKSVFNNNRNDNAYVGLKYTIREVHGTNINSAILGEENSVEGITLYGWYNNNIKNNYNNYLDLNAGFICDRAIYSGTGIGTNNTIYAAYNRLVTNKTPTLICNNENDILKIPIGLITADEVVYAGMVYRTDSRNSYLYLENQSNWTMSPYWFSDQKSGVGKIANIFAIGGGTNGISTSVSNNTEGVRPVINLKSNVQVTGTGTLTDPYVVTSLYEENGGSDTPSQPSIPSNGTIFKPIKVTSAQLNSLSLQNGQFIITTDTKKIYVDMDNERKLFNAEVGGSGSVYWKTYINGEWDSPETPEPVPETKIYGIKRSLTTVSSAWERTDDAVGLVANAQVGTDPVVNNFDSLYPWSDIYTYSWNKDTGEETRYDAAGFSYTDDYIFTKIPTLWYKRWQDSTHEYIQIATAELEGFTKCDEFSVGRYTMSGTTSAPTSKSGVAPLVSQTRASFRTAAAKLSGCCLIDWRYFILQILYLVEYADYNSQAKLGQGWTSGNSTALTNGSCDTLGMKSGRPTGTDGKTGVIYRGVENIFGNIWQWVDGINISSRKAYVCTDPTKYADNTTSGDYVGLSYTNASSNGYASKLGYDANRSIYAFPIAASGSETTYVCDYYYQSSGSYVAAVGGAWYHTLTAGLFYWNLNYIASDANTYSGSRLLKYQ